MVAQQTLVLLVEVRIRVRQQKYNNMRKITGYKGMLRDRCPKVVNYALKWQKAKERWIEHAYVNFIKLYVDNKERNHATRIVLGIAKFYRNFDFHKSIEWDNLLPEDKLYWERVEGWVNWFMKNYAYIENMYEISRKAGKSEFDIKVEIINSYLKTLLPSPDMKEEEKQAKYAYVDSLVDFLIKCFEDRI